MKDQYTLFDILFTDSCTGLPQEATSRRQQLRLYFPLYAEEPRLYSRNGASGHIAIARIMIHDRGQSQTSTLHPAKPWPNNTADIISRKVYYHPLHAHFVIPPPWHIDAAANQLQPVFLCTWSLGPISYVFHVFICMIRKDNSLMNLLNLFYTYLFCLSILAALLWSMFCSTAAHLIHRPGSSLSQA